MSTVKALVENIATVKKLNVDEEVGAHNNEIVRRIKHTVLLDELVF